VPLTPSAPSPSDERIGQLDHDLRMLLSTFAAAVFLSPAPKIVPFRGRATLPAAWRRLSRWIDEQIENRLANPIEHVDMLQVLLDARDEDGEPLSRQDLIAELAILIAVVTRPWWHRCPGRSRFSEPIPKRSNVSSTKWTRWKGHHPSTRI
jgi:hypothetical protein